MANYEETRVTLTNSKLKTLKSSAKNKTGKTLWINFNDKTESQNTKKSLRKQYIERHET